LHAIWNKNVSGIKENDIWISNYGHSLSSLWYSKRRLVFSILCARQTVRSSPRGMSQIWPRVLDMASSRNFLESCFFVLVTSRNLPSINTIMTRAFFFSSKYDDFGVIFLFIFGVYQGAKFLSYKKKKHWFKSSWNFGCNFFSFGCLCTHHMHVVVFYYSRKLCELSSVHKMMCPPDPLFWGGDMDTLP
jgi:hypothetical protein